MILKNVLLKKYIYIIIACAILLLTVFFPLSDNTLQAGNAMLTPLGRVSLGILLFCLFMWITEPIPFHITGMIGLILIALAKVDTFKGAVAIGFGNDTVVFFIGVLVLSAAMSASGLGQRISMLVLSLTGNSTSKILLGFLTIGTLLSMWVTDMAVAAILTPLALAILRKERIEPLKSKFGKGLMIACAWGPIVGGIGTPAGAGPNQLAIGFLREMLGIEVSFLQWMIYGVPSALLLIVPSWVVLMLFFKPEVAQLSTSTEELKRAYHDMPRISRNEVSTIIVFIITIILWITSSSLGKYMGVAIPTSLPALLGTCLLFLPGVTSFSWKQINEEISWSGILLIAAGITIGMEVFNTGAAAWISNLLFGGIAQMQPVVMIFVLIIIISLLKVGLSSNTVTATIIIPILIVMVQEFNLPVLGILIPASLTLSLALILVTSTPTSVIPYATGYFKISDMVKAGIVLTIVSALLMTATIYGIGLLTGIY